VMMIEGSAVHAIQTMSVNALKGSPPPRFAVI
jgi:hypothetical protein